MMSATAQLIGVTATLLLASGCLCLYRLFFHPLARVPGNFSQRISIFPRIWQCRSGDRHLRELESHKKFGTAIRIAPNAISFSSLSALQTIHAKDANVFKGDEFYGLLDGGTEGGHSIQMTADNAAHASRRRVLDKAMPPREHAFVVLNDLAKLFAETMMREASSSGAREKDWPPPVDVNLITSWFGFDVISLIAFGESLDLLRSQKYRYVPGCLQTSSIFLFWAGYSPFLGFWRWFVGSSLPSLLRLRTIQESQRYTEFSDHMLDKRATRIAAEEKGDEESRSTDIFQHLLRSKLYTSLDLRADSSLLIAAGSDAIRLTVAATIFYWLKDPAIFKRAQAEIRNSVASANKVTEASLSSLRFVRASIDETMRLCPPKASSLPREVMAGGIVVDGIHVPAGCTVGISMYALHHDPEIYPEPFQYNPDRWLVEPLDRRMKEAFCPFLKGPRACPGKTVAYFAMQLALFHLMYRFDIRAGGGKVSGGGHSSLHRLRWREDEYQFNDWILGYAEGPLVELRERV